MARHRVHIENLQVRIPRKMASSAQAIARGVGSEIAHSVANTSQGKKGVVRIDEISATGIRAAAGMDSVREAVARKVAAELKKKLGEEK